MLDILDNTLSILASILAPAGIVASGYLIVKKVTKGNRQNSTGKGAF